jgi:hypothetical protein
MLNVIENINLAVPLAGGGIGTDVTGGLSLRWTYGGITGSKWTDLSGNGNHGYKSGSGTVSDSGSQLGYKFDGSSWFEVPTTTGDVGVQYKNAGISAFPFTTGSTIIYYATLNGTADQYLWNRSQVSQSFGSGGGNAGWGHVINLESTQSSNRAPQDASAAFGGYTGTGMGMKYSIEHLVDMVEDGYAIDTPFFKGGWNFWPTTSSANIALASSSFEGGIPVFVVFRDSYQNTSARYPSGYYDIQTSGSATFELNVKPPNENLPVLINSDPTSNKYLYSRNNYNKGGVAPVNYIMGKSQYYISSSIGGFTGTLLETRIYSRQLTDSEVYRVCNAIRQNLQVSGSFR